MGRRKDLGSRWKDVIRKEEGSRKDMEEEGIPTQLNGPIVKDRRRKGRNHK